jgi:tRNA-specific adenosine deaminase 1
MNSFSLVEINYPMADVTSFVDNVAQRVLETYNSSPKTGKPTMRSNGIAEWTVLAGIVAELSGIPAQIELA